MYPYEAERKEHVRTYGSFLYCPERDTVCSFMEGMWKTGHKCDRSPCILDDPEDIALQERIRKRREQMAAGTKEQKPADKPQIRDQRNQTTSIREKIMNEIHALEDASKEAYRNNNPKKGEDLFHKAMYKRMELREWMRN